MSITSRSHASEVMSRVDHKEGVIFLSDFLKLNEIGSVSIHGEETLCNYEDTFIWIFLTKLLDLSLHALIAKMLNFVNILSSCLSSLKEAIVVKGIHDNVIVCLHESLNNNSKPI